MKTQITASNAPSTKGYPISHAIESGGFVFTSGQVYLNQEMELIEGTIEEKTHQVMKNLQAILKEASVTFDSVVKSTIYVTSMETYGQVNDVYASYFAEPYPAREVVCVKSLPLGAEIEISVIAEK